MNFLDAMKKINNYTYTENGAVALKSTNSALLDAFGVLGAYNRITWNDDIAITYVLDKFYKAWSENRALAIKMLFYLRDIRGGQGCRTLFRIIMVSLANKYPEYVTHNLDNFLFFGRGDDLIYLLDTPVEDSVVSYISTVLEEDVASVKNGGFCSLLAKWLPSENASSMFTKQAACKLINKLNMKPSQYRKTLSMLRNKINIVETLMSQNRWEEIDFSTLPSRAAMLYSDAFYKHSPDKYLEYIGKLASGESKVNAKALLPVDIVHRLMNRLWSITKKDIILNDAMWKALPNYFEEAGVDETGICVVDTSGSMYGTPLEVAVSLGMYCADKAKGPYKNHFITFSGSPELQEIKGDTIVDKIACLERANWDMNTNIEAVFDLILKTAISNNVKQEDIPNKLYIISDMQWDDCVTTERIRSRFEQVSHTVEPETFIESMSRKYAMYGYTLPAIVYWNVRNSSCGMFQQTKDSNQCCFVSGYSPSLFKAVLLGTEYEEEVNEAGEKITKVKMDPMTIMLNTLNDDRYNMVWTGDDA